ncbi:MAG: cyclase family protein [Acidobacteria bacterium]|nr:cyclase family protein [Acidobacteriota bacterium]
MRANRIGTAAAAGALAIGIALSGPLAAQESQDVTGATVEQWMTDLSNWGRWGDDDQAGTLNLITPEKRTAAAALVTAGIPVSLSHTYLTEPDVEATFPVGYEMLGPDRPGPFRSDRYTFAYHGYAHSHMDSLCHMMHDGRMYNGFVRDEEVTADGCAKLAVINFKQGIVGRGVLMDIPRLRGVDYLEPGTAIHVEDLEAWERESGDVLFVRTGRWARRAEHGPWEMNRDAAGLHASVAPWLRERGVAMLGADGTNDVLPSGVEGVTQPIHQLTIIAMGMPLFDNLDLEAVAAEAARRNRWEFLLVAAPLAVDGGTGSPLNPLAIF